MQVLAQETTDIKFQLTNPVLTTNSFDDNILPPNQDKPPPYRQSATLNSVAFKKNDSSIAAIGSSAAVQEFLQRSIHLAVDDLFASGTVERLMESSLNQVTSFDAAYRGTYDGGDYDICKVPVSGEEKAIQRRALSAKILPTRDRASAAPKHAIRSLQWAWCLVPCGSAQVH